MPDDAALIETPPAATPAPGDDSAAVLALIERAARDPAVDVEKFRTLFALRRELEAERARLAFVEDFARLLPELPAIDRNGRLVVYSRADRDKPGGPREDDKPIQSTPYAQFDDIVEAIRPALAAHGFSVRFAYDTSPDGRLVVTAFLMHRGGHETRASCPPLQHDTTGSKNSVQAIGSSLSYGMRYALRGVLPIVSHAPQDKDDDGAAAGEAVTVDPDQAEDVDRRLTETASDRSAFLRWIGAESVERLTVAQYKRAVEYLAEKARRKAASHA